MEARTRAMVHGTRRANDASEDPGAWTRRVAKGASAQIEGTSERARALAGAERVAEAAPALALEIAAQAWVAHGKSIEDAVKGAMGRWRFELRLRLEATMDVEINDDPWRFDSDRADRAAATYVLGAWRASGALARARRSARRLAEIGDRLKGRDMATLIAAGSASPALWAKLASAPRWTWREAMHDRALWRRPVPAWPAHIAAARTARAEGVVAKPPSRAEEARVWRAARAWRWRDESPPVCALLALARAGTTADTDRERAAAIIAERAYASPEQRGPDAGAIEAIAQREPEATEQWIQSSALATLMQRTAWSEVRAQRTLRALDEAWRREPLLEHGGAETLVRLGQSQGVYVWHVPYVNAARMIAGSASAPPGPDGEALGEPWVRTATNARAMKVDIGHLQRTVLGEIPRGHAERAHVGPALARVVRAGLG